MTDMETIISLCKRRGFIFPGSDIYGGLANSWDYGPLGVALKNAIKQEWWKMFVQKRLDMVGIDAALLMNPRVWEASGHVATFTDPLIECASCHARFRDDHVTKEEDGSWKCGACAKKNGKTVARQFNLMLKTFLGPAEEQANTVYFRPETAQAMFVDFKAILETTRKRLPFGVAQIGKAFRNEITPGNFIFRTREFEQMEIEYFVRESEWEEHFEHWLTQVKTWINHLGVHPEHVHYVEIADEDRAHYSKRTVDVEYNYPFGQKELYGLAYRGNYDLTQHAQHSGKDLVYTDPDNQSDKFLPHVIEPSFGVDRTVLVALLEAYHEEQVQDETRIVMKFPFWMAPVTVAVLPLSKKEPLTDLAQNIAQHLGGDFRVEYDETQSIGKRYRRQDEIGTPFCVTVDFDSLEDKSVTVRHRDTMEQERVLIDNLAAYITEKMKG